MPVKHALLALLAERDFTGYELKLRFERVMGEFWQLNSGQVYSTLERLRRAGMIARRASLERGAPAPEAVAESGVRRADDVTRITFSLLPRGRRALAQWLAAPTPRLRPVRDPLFVKLAFSAPEEIPAILRAFAAESQRYGEAAETLRALVAREPMSHGGRVRWLVAEATRLNYEAQLEWIARVQRTLALHAPAPADVPPRSAEPRALRVTRAPREAVA
jgi:DNA-binding PadR family transcriptional regulator